MANLRTVAAFASESKGAFTEAQVRWWILNAESNGMAKAGVILRIGKRVYIDPEAFDRWVQQTNGR